MTTVLKVVITLLAWVPFNTMAQERLTLEQAIRKALENNYDIRLSDVTAQTAKANNTLGNAGFLPNVNAVAGSSIANNNTNLEFVDGRTITTANALNYGYSGGLNIGWTVFAGGRAYYVRKQLNTLEQISEVQLKAQVQATISQTIQAYSAVVYNQQQIGSVDTAIELARARMDLSKAKFEIGTSAKVDYLQGRVDFNASRSQLLLRDADLETARANLNALMGEDETKTYIAEDSLILNLALEPTDKDLLRNNNLLLDAARRTALLGLVETKIARTAYLPSLTINGGYAYNYTHSQAGQFVFNRGFGPTGNASLNIPIFQGGNIRRQVKVATLQARSDQLTYERQSTQLGSQYRSAWKSYENAVSGFKLEEENIGYARENLDIQKARFKVGIATSIELREAENSYVQALARKNEASYNVKVNETKVLELESKLAK